MRTAYVFCALAVMACSDDAAPTGPSFSLTPPPEAWLRGTVTFTATTDASSDTISVLALDIRGTSVDCNLTGECVFDTATVADGATTATATLTTNGVTVTDAADVQIDNTIPTITFASPAGTFVPGAATLVADADDATSGVVSVDFTYGGASVGTATTPDTGGTWSTAWNAAAAAASGTLAAVATDAAGNKATISRDITVDTVAPKVVNVAAQTADGVYNAPDAIVIAVSFDETVVVTGSPTLALNTNKVATYTSGSSSQTLLFTYTIQAGDNTTDLDYAATTSLALAGGTIADLATNVAELALPAPTEVGSLGVSSNIVVDTTAPTVKYVSSPKPNGTYSAGTGINIGVNFTEAVFVTGGTPTLTLDMVGTDRVLAMTSGDGTTVLRFQYNVQGADSSPDLDYVATTSLALNGSTIADAAGNAAVVTLAAPASADSLGGRKDLIIEAQRPTVVRVSSAKADGAYGATETININVVFSEPLVLTAAVFTLTLETGDILVGQAGASANTLTFPYVVGVGDVSIDLDYVSTSSLALTAGTIRDADNNDALLTLPPPGPCGESLAGNKNLTIEGNASLNVRPLNLPAPAWNDYVTTLDNSVACAVSDTGRGVCEHGGERRRVVTTETSCTGLAMTDALGVFDWSCRIINTRAHFFGSLKTGKGLKDLVTATAWKANSVTLTGGAGGTSSSAVWWKNPVIPLPATPGTAQLNISEQCTIYTETAVRTTPGFILDGDKSAVVTLAGASLAPSTNSQALLSSVARHNWIEVTASNNAMPVNSLLSVSGTTSRVHASTASHSSRVAISLRGSGHLLTQTTTTQSDVGLSVGSSSDVVDYTATETLGQGLALEGIGSRALRVRLSGGGYGIVIGGSANIVEDFTIADTTGGGFSLAGSSNMLFDGRIFNTAQAATIYGPNHRLSRIVVGNVTQGFEMSTVQTQPKLTMTAITVAHSAGRGFGTWYGTERMVLHNVLIPNSYGPMVAYGAGTISQFAFANSSILFNLANSANYKFTGNLLFGPTGCIAATNAMGLNTACANTGVSNATLRTGITLASSFVGKVSSDSQNASGLTTGTATYSAALDWFKFLNAFRTWGRDGGTFPMNDNRDRCSGAMTCRIWDWSLASADTVVRNTSLSGNSPNPAFVAASACPTNGDDFLESATYTYDATYAGGLNGVEATTNAACASGQTCKQRYLKAAIEDLGDGVGDDDGLCETRETCTYAPNFGAYQGHGARSSCVFTDGGVSLVTMLGYANNGR